MGRVVCGVVREDGICASRTGIVLEAVRASGLCMGGILGMRFRRHVQGGVDRCLVCEVEVGSWKMKARRPVGFRHLRNHWCSNTIVGDTIFSSNRQRGVSV